MLSLIFARYVVSESIGLPPQDFDVSVAVVALVLYFPVCSIVCAFLILIFMLLAAICWGLIALLSMPLNFILGFLGAFSLRAANAAAKFQGWFAGLDAIFLKGFLGPVCVAMIAVLFWDWSYKSILGLTQSAFS